MYIYIYIYIYINRTSTWGTSLIRNHLLLGSYRGLCLGPYGNPRRVGFFLRARFPCTESSAESEGSVRGGRTLGDLTKIRD